MKKISRRSFLAAAAVSAAALALTACGGRLPHWQAGGWLLPKDGSPPLRHRAMCHVPTPVHRQEAGRSLLAKLRFLKYLGYICMS